MIRNGLFIILLLKSKCFLKRKKNGYNPATIRLQVNTLDTLPIHQLKKNHDKMDI